MAALKSDGKPLCIQFPPRVPRGGAVVMESRSRLSLSPPVTLHLIAEQQHISRLTNYVWNRDKSLVEDKGQTYAAGIISVVLISF